MVKFAKKQQLLAGWAAHVAHMLSFQVSALASNLLLRIAAL
jgi:hypothetical protein